VIKLNYNFGFKWWKNKDVFVKGFLTDQDGKYCESEDLLEYFNNIDKYHEFKRKIKNANGLFSVIIKNGNNYFVAVDKLRTFPLFYYETKDEYIITDDTSIIQSEFNLSINKISQDELLSSGYITDKYTMYNDLFQLQASELIIFNNNDLVLNKEFYRSYATNKVSSSSPEELEKDFLNILDNVSKRLIKSLNGRMALIPLSGGYDSRLVATLLKKHNYSNVICFTYGNKNSFEVKISKEVAQKLGFKWFYVEYTQELIGYYVNTDTFNQYYKYAYNNTACFLLQDYFAIQYLKDNNLVNKDAIVITGHSGDLLAGSQLPLEIKYKSTNSKIVNKVMSQTYALSKPKNYTLLKYRIYDNLTENYAYSIVENFFVNRKIARFIINSHRIYEFFGFEHRLPLWDDELTEFFRILPYKYKSEPYFYEEVLLKTLFKVYDIDIVPPDKIGRNTFKAKIKRKLKKFTPKFIVDFREKLLFENINNVDFISAPLIKDCNNKIENSIHIDKIIVKWLLNKSS